MKSFFFSFWFQIVNARVDGQCCWKVFPKKNYRGELDVFQLSEDRAPRCQFHQHLTHAFFVRKYFFPPKRN